MSKFEHVPAWSFPHAHQPKVMQHEYPGPGKYPVSRDLKHGVSFAKSGRNVAAQGSKFDYNEGVGPGSYYRGYSSLTKNGILFKGGKFQEASGT